MKYMFASCRNLAVLNVSNFNTGNVTNMTGMFLECSSLTSLDVRGFDTSNVTNMNYMFSGCTGLTSLDVSGFNTSNVTTMRMMFNNCVKLEEIDVSRFDTSKVADMGGMFWYCSKLKSLDLSNFDTRAITSSGEVEGSNGTIYPTGLAKFARSCPSLTEIILGENFGQSTNVPEAGSELSMFYVGSNVNTTVHGANSVMSVDNYGWSSDNRTYIAGSMY